MSFEVLLVFGPLMLGMVALWLDLKIASRVDLWMAFLIVASGFALVFGYMDFKAVLYIFLFGGTVYLYYQKRKSFYFIFILILAIPLLTHFNLTGFHNYRFLNAVGITGDALPFSLYFNFDKAVIGLFIIGFGFKNRKLNIASLYRDILTYLMVMAGLLLGMALVMGYTRFEPKVPGFTLVWVLVNLFFVCHAEEALFRGLIQKKIESIFKFKFGKVISLFMASALFGLAHYKGGAAYILLATVAGLFYGHIFQKTKNIAAPVLLHFSFNLLHFLLFTYPALKP